MIPSVCSLANTIRQAPWKASSDMIVMLAPAIPTLLDANLKSSLSLVSGALTLLSSLRGGGSTPLENSAAEALAGFDLNRVKIRLEGLSSYGVISALMMNAALRLFSATPKKLDTIIPTPNSRESTGRWSMNTAKVIFMISCVLSILCGTFATVVFSLLSVYAKTALGMGMDGPFLEFFQATARVRLLAFDAFVLSLVTFETSFVSSLFINSDGPLRWWACGLAAAAAIISFWQWGFIMKVASMLLFARKVVSQT